MIDLLTQSPLLFVIYAIALFGAISVHEFSHALVADRLGDPTPRIQGRVTLNPRAHIDLMGMLFLFVFGFGWGRPVEFDPFNLTHPRRDAALISVAGPISNLIIAILCSAIYTATAFTLLIPFITLNVMLAVFNLLPIHPLDGFKIVGGLLPEEKAREWYQLERYGILFLILLILPVNGGSMLSKIISPVVQGVLSLLVH